MLTAERVLDVFRGIADETLLVLGLNPVYARPEWMILQAMAVPPLAVRPAAARQVGAISMRWPGAWRSSPLSLTLSGQCTISGVATPPSWV